MIERLPIAACRSRLTFDGADLFRLRRDLSASTVGVSGFPREAGIPTRSLKNQFRADVTEATGSATRAEIR
jgi:hypothetical protein